MAGEKCRNCEAPLNGATHCGRCGANSKAQKFEAGDDPLLEIASLKTKLAAQQADIEALKKTKKDPSDDI